MSRGRPCTPDSHSEVRRLCRSPLLDTALVFVGPTSCNRGGVNLVSALFIEIRDSSTRGAGGSAALQGPGRAKSPARQM